MSWETLLFCLGSVAVGLGCMIPNRYLPNSLPNDKLLHFASFAVLAGLALRIAHGWTQAGLWLLGLLIAGWAIECVQALVPDRKFCWRDIGANAAGVAFTLVCAGLYAVLA
jgi:hypothetical protein